MAKNSTHRDSAGWKRGLAVLERACRLANSLPVPDGQRIADALVRAASSVPALVVEAERTRDRTPLDRALLETEALVTVVVRLGYLTESQVGPAVQAIDALRDSLVTESPKAVAPPKVIAADPEAPPAVPRAHAPAPPRPRQEAQRNEPERLFVDGCNFLGCAPGYQLGDVDSRDRLLFRLQEYAREHPAHKVVVFFDGQRASRRLTAGVEERITSDVHNADEVILDEISRLARPERSRCTLITDDRDLSSRARREGVRTEGVQWLASHLIRRRPNAPTKVGISKSELSEWEQFFNEPPRRPGSK